MVVKREVVLILGMARTSLPDLISDERKGRTKNIVSRSAKGQQEEPPSLKNAWVRKDADGDYYLFIRVRSGDGAMLNLTALNPTLDEQIKNEINPSRDKSSLTRQVLDTWIAEQDSSLVKVEQQRDSNNSFEDFADVIDD
jgi:hypothetical protein